MKKIKYNEKTPEELTLELAKLRGSIRQAQAAKLKTGNATEYRTTRKNIARILTAMKAGATK